MLVKLTTVISLLAIVGLNCMKVAMFRPMPPPYYNTNFSAGSAYDPNTEICCSGISNAFDMTLSPKCCGFTAYDPSRKICCQENVLDLEIGKFCCGNRTIDTSSNLCCDDVSFPRSSRSLLCCNNATYDSAIQLCCPYNEPSIISKDGDSSRSLCCGDKPYNPTTEICYTKTSVDSKGHSQIQNNVIKKTKRTDQACCGNVTYNYNTNVCCGEKLYNNSYSCCADKEPYLSVTQFCCMDYLTQEYEIMNTFIGCCGSKSYDPIKQACCNGKVSDNTSGRTKGCCADEFYDTDIEVCCYYYNSMPYDHFENGIITSAATTTEKPQSVLRKTSSSDNNCCNGVPYNDQEQYCCFDERTNKQYVAKRLSPFAYQCCGDVVFEYGDGICCGGVTDNWKTQPRFHKFETSNHYDLQCCGDQAYNISLSSCCGGLPLDTCDGKKACCGDDKVYDTDTQTCCVDYTNYPSSSKVHDNINFNPECNRCCGFDVYDFNEEMCCQNKVYKLKDGLCCCGNKTYDDTKEVCCMDDVITKEHENQNNCCNYYSTQDQYPRPPYYYHTQDQYPQSAYSETQDQSPYHPTNL